MEYDVVRFEEWFEDDASLLFTKRHVCKYANIPNFVFTRLTFPSNYSWKLHMIPT